jgi:hypothetical protein
MVPGLSATDIAYLNAAHCQVEAYRTDQDAGPRRSAAPDENDLMMLVRGEFAAKGTGRPRGFFKQHGTMRSYYGDSLQVLSSKEALGTKGEIFAEGDLVTSQQWRLAVKDAPAIEHDALDYTGFYDIVLYCSNRKWVKLMDRYSDTMD